MKVLKFDKDSVLVQTESLKVWMDYSIDNDGHLEMDWNQYIFHTNDLNDMCVKSFQDDANNYIEVGSCVERTLLNEGIVLYNDEDRYSYSDEWESITEMQIL